MFFFLRMDFRLLCNNQNLAISSQSIRDYAYAEDISKLKTDLIWYSDVLAWRPNLVKLVYKISKWNTFSLQMSIAIFISCIFLFSFHRLISLYPSMIFKIQLGPLSFHHSFIFFFNLFYIFSLSYLAIYMESPYRHCLISIFLYE